MAKQSGKAPTVDLQALLARAKDMHTDTTSMPNSKPCLADSLHNLESQVAQIMTVQLEKFEEIIGVVNSMKTGYKQIGSEVEKIQADLEVLQGKLAKDKVDKIQADHLVFQGKLEEVASSLKKMEDCQNMEVDGGGGSKGNELEEVHGEINSLKAGCELIDQNVSKIQADMKLLQGRLQDNRKVNEIQTDLLALKERFEDVISSSQQAKDCHMDNARDDEEEGSSDSGDESETDADCSTCTEPVGETAITPTRTDESGKKSRQTIQSPIELNQRCKSCRDRIYPLLNKKMEETKRIFPDTLAKLGSNTSEHKLRCLMYYYNLEYTGKTSFEMQHSIAKHIGIPRAVREQCLVKH